LRTSLNNTMTGKMTRLANLLFCLSVLASWSGAAFAQAAYDETSSGDGYNADAAEDGLDEELDDGLDDFNDPILEDDIEDPDDLSGAVAPRTDGSSRAAKSDWADIVVVQRKPFLKSGRLELQPLAGVTINDNLIRHYGFGGDLTYFLTDVFGVGVQGMYFLKELTARESLIGQQYSRSAGLNKYLWQASLNFTYVPVYGKFALFGGSIMHWDVFASGGIGVTQTEIIPRRSDAEAFQHLAITPNFGIGTRLYLWDWLAFNFAIRDYILPDKFEPLNRGRDQSIDEVKANAEGKLIQNVMIYAGLGFYLPSSFSYRTPR